MAVGLYDWALIVDHQKKTVSLLSHRDVQARLDWLEAQQIMTCRRGWRGWRRNGLPRQRRLPLPLAGAPT